MSCTSWKKARLGFPSSGIGADYRPMSGRESTSDPAWTQRCQLAGPTNTLIYAVAHLAAMTRSLNRIFIVKATPTTDLQHCFSRSFG